MSNQLPWPSKPKPTRRKTTMSRTFKYNILVDTMHVFDGFIVSSSEARDTSFYLHPSLSLSREPPLHSPNCTCPLETCRCRWLSLVFCLVPPKKKPLKMSTKCSKVAKLSLNISHLLSHSHRHSASLSLYLWLVWLSLLWPRT